MAGFNILPSNLIVEQCCSRRAPSGRKGRNYLSSLPKYTMVARCYRRNRSLTFTSEGSGLERSIPTFHSAKSDRLAVLARVLILVAYNRDSRSQIMLDWVFRLIRFRQRRIIVLRLRSSFTYAESGRLMKHEPAGDARSTIFTAGSNRK
jgi:hypothetical protein